MKMKKGKPAPRPAFVNNRKAKRKQERNEKKQKRLEHYTNKKKILTEKPKFTPGAFVRRPSVSPEPEKVIKAKKHKVQPAVHEILIKQRQKELKETNKLKSEMEKQRREMLLQENEDEDKVIKKLEKQLGLNKVKNKKNFFASDGLDYLLEICDKSTTEKIVAAEKHLANVDGDSDFEDDLAAVTGKEIKKDKKKKDVKDGNSTDDEIGDQSGDDDSFSGDEEFDDEGDSIGDESELSGDEDLEGEESDFGDEGSGSDDTDASDDDVDEPPKKKTQDTNTSQEKKKKDTKISKNTQKNEENGKKDKKTKVIEQDEFSDEDMENPFSDDEVSDLPSDDDDEPPQKKTKGNKTKPETNKKNAKTAKNIQNNDVKNKKSKTTEQDDFSDEDIENPFSDDEVSDLPSDDDHGSGDEEQKVDVKEKPDVWEDIYGRKRDKEGNIIKEEKGAYIPPHLRNKELSADKNVTQLTRQVKSVLNKLSGQNLHWACGTIESLYSCHSRQSVNTCLSSQWLTVAVSTSRSAPRLLCEHAALIAGLHANVADDVGAHFLQVMTKMFDEMIHHTEPIEDKKLENLVSCFACLYSFKLYNANLLYDILKKLVESLTEKNIECIVAILRTAGAALRKDDPVGLKNFIHDVQGKAAGLDEGVSDGSRIKFLIEVLMAVKNNNLNKIPNYDPTYIEQLKKSIKTIIRKGNYITPLNIGLEDLLKAEERGKWWVVGSAWEGKSSTSDKVEKAPLPTVDQKLLELARKQRMNTDVRRSIFCVIMSAEDYMDAFEKLQHLGLKGQQEREIVHVLLACCLQEKTYNPYYSVLACKLCDTDRRYQLSIQFSIWDKIKEIESIAKQSLSNMAQFIIHLIMEKSLPLSILKVIEFSDLNKSTVKFMRQILLAIIMNADQQASLEVFQKISSSKKLHMFRESLRLFIQHFLVRNAGKKTSVSDSEIEVLKTRTLEVERILTMHDSKLKL